MSLKIFSITVVVLSAVLSITMYKGLPPFLGDASYLDFNVSQSFIQGQGFSLGPNLHGDFKAFGKRPPGFSIFVGILIKCGFPIIVASLIVSTLSYVMTSLMIFLALRTFFNNVCSFLSTLMVVCYAPLIYYSKIAAPEIIGLAILSGMFYYYLKLIRNCELSFKENFTTLFLFGFISGLTIWVRYANMIYVLLFFSLIFIYTFIFKRKLIVQGFVTLSIGSLMTIALMIRNYLSTGNYAGHPANNMKTNDFTVAIIKSINVLFKQKIKFDQNSELSAYILIGVLVLMAVVVLVMASKNLNKLFEIAPIALMPLSYLIFFCYIQSTTRIDDVSDRYLLPFLVTVLLQVIYIYNFIYLKTEESKKIFALFSCSVLLGFIYLNISHAAVERKYNDRDYSPSTLRYLIKNAEEGSVVIGNRYLSQIFMHTLKFKVVAFPFYSAYNKDYGRKLKWSKKDFLEIVQKHKVKTVVFFTGLDLSENFLKRGDYGNFVTQLINGNSELIEERIQLEDGIFIRLKDHNEINDKYIQLKSDYTLIKGSNRVSDLKLIPHKSNAKYTKKGIMIHEKGVDKSTYTQMKFNGIDNCSGMHIKFDLPKEEVKMLSFTLYNNKGDYAHFFIDSKNFKINEVDLIPETISRNHGFDFGTIEKISFRVYPLSSKNITEFTIREIIAYKK